MKKQNIIVKQHADKELEVPFEVMAQSISDISKFAQAVKKSRLNEKAILVLVQHATDVSQNTIKAVIDALADLERKYLKP